VEPGNLVDNYRRSIRIVPIDYQSKRGDVCTATQRRRCDVVVAWRTFRWEGEPQRKAQKRPVRLYTEATHVCTSNLQLESRHLPPAPPPSSHTAYITIQYGTYIRHGNQTTYARRQEACDKPLNYPPYIPPYPTA